MATPVTEFEQDWSLGLGATLGDRKLKNIILVTGIFREKPIAMLLRFECVINSQNLMKIVGAIFEKIKIKIYFLCELLLILGVDQKRKN